MGTWSYDMLGGDEPMDVLGVLSDLIDYTRDGDEPGSEYRSLYPLVFTPDEAAEVCRGLEKLGDEALLAHPFLGADDHPQIVATVFLATGAAMSDHLREVFIVGCEREISEAGTIGRTKVLRDHIEAIRAHETGKIINIEHVGLFEKMALHVEEPDA